MSEQSSHTAGISPVPMGVMLVIFGVIAALAALDLTIMGRTPWILAAFAPLAWAVPVTVRCVRDEGFTFRSTAILGLALIPGAVVVIAMLGANPGRWWPVIMVAAGLGLLVGRR